jgi:uncharacterized membrane protein YfcA
MSKAVSFLAGLLAVIAGAGSALVWLGDNASPLVVVASGMVLYGSAFGLLWEWLEKRNVVGLRVWGLLALGTFIAGYLASRVADAGRVELYLYVSVGAVTAFWFAYQLDQLRSKECPDCCEAVKAGARVCRFCGYEFRSTAEG